MKKINANDESSNVQNREAQMISATIEELSASTEQLAASGSSIEDMTNGLLVAINKFKI